MKKYMGAEELLEHYKNAGSAAIKRMCDNEKVRNKMEENKTYCDEKDLLYMDSTQEKDMKALGELEENLQDLRQLEKNMFPKPTPKIPDMIGGEQYAVSQIEVAAEDGGEVSIKESSEEKGEKQDIPVDASHELAGEDASAENDSPRD